MAVTIHFSGLTQAQLRRVLLTHNGEFQTDAQPRHIAAEYAQEHARGAGCIVTVEGAKHYSVTTLPLYPASATKVAQAAVEPAPSELNPGGCRG